MHKKFRVVIIALSVLLTVSVLSLIVTLLYNHFNPAEPSAVVVPNNLISPASETRADTSAQNTEEITVSTDGSDGSETGVPAESDAAAALTESREPSYASPATPNDDDGPTAEALYFHTKNTDDNTAFRVTNMFPGDSETKYYCVRVAHKGDVVLRYHADIQPGYEKLAEVLKCRVKLLTTGETLYDGLMRDMPESLNHELPTDVSATSEVYYEITAYLDTSVGNDYQQKELIANFRWWVEEVDNLEAPKTSGTGVLISVSGAVLSLFLIIVLWKRRSKEEEADDAA